MLDALRSLIPDRKSAVRLKFNFNFQKILSGHFPGTVHDAPRGNLIH